MKWYVFTAMILNLTFVVPSHGQNIDFLDIGFRDVYFKLFNFYNEKTPTGSYIKSIYEKNVQLRTNEQNFENLPKEFEPIIEIIHNYVQENSKQKLQTFKSKSGKIRYESDPNNFYSGNNGIKNGPGFTFKKEELPTKIARLSFCFGVDPLIYTSLLHQESKFSKYAVSSTGASGFSQLTDQAIAEVSEQLDILGAGYRAANSVEFLNQAINCYMGSNKTWVNMWEDGTIPKGKAAYKNSFVGVGRKWLYVTKSKNWLNEDPDRNLVYGIIFFKTQLSLKSNKYSYSRALKDYNVGEKETYLRKIQNFYGNLAPDLVKGIIDSVIKEKGVGSFSRIDYRELQFSNDDEYCSIPNYDSSWILPVFTMGLYEDVEIIDSLKEEWIKTGRCRKTSINL